MVRSFARLSLCSAMLVSLTVTFAAIEQPALGADAPVKKVLSKRGRGRLPANYAPVVNEEQRQKIYKLQEEYQPKIEALETKLKAMKKERDDKIASVLTAEQKKQITEATGKTKGQPTPPAANPPATPPTGQKTPQ
jgi:hypothetical protein